MSRQRFIVTDTSWSPDLTQFPGPKYLALSRALRDSIRSGELPANSQLPTVRARLALLHDVQGEFSAGVQDGLYQVRITLPAPAAPRPAAPAHASRTPGPRRSSP